MSKRIKRSKFRSLLLVSMLIVITIALNAREFGEQPFLVDAANQPNNKVSNTAGCTTSKAASKTGSKTASKSVNFKTKNKVKYAKYNGTSYKVVSVKGGDLSGTRLCNVAVDIGYGSRTYWGFTNDYGQLVYVVADQITLQDQKTDKVLSNGRYYKDEAKVPGTEREDLDEGHVIADSLGGVSNAYNITPQNSTLNRHGDQAYMEKVIRDAGGCNNFRATITYPDTKTQIPSSYRYEYEIDGNQIVDEFDNVDPDEVNNAIISEQVKEDEKKLAEIDQNGNGKVTIAEAKAAGYKMPITKEFWLYQYMDDRDGDGMVGE